MQGLRSTLSCALAAGLAIVLASCSGDAPTADPAPEAEGTAEAAPEPAPEPVAPRPRGLWVLAEGSQRVLENPERLDEMFEAARALGTTDLFVQVYRAGRAWYDADRADATPFREVRERTGIDPLASLLERAKREGLRVHAWVNVLALSKNRDAPIVAALGDTAIHVDRKGRSLLEYPDYDVPQPDRRYYRMGTPGLYLDPAAPGLGDHLAETYAELLVRYPSFDGLHYDYIRYPDVLPFAPGSRFGVGLDFGYAEPTRARFRAETGREAPLGDSLRNASAWDQWRRDKLTELVAMLSAAARSARPGIEISAAVWTYADRGYLVLAQDWRGWLEAGHIDLAVPMSYTRDDTLLRYQAQAFAGMPYGDRIWMGLGSWLFAKEPARAMRQLEIVRDAGVVGESLFSYDSIVDTPALLDGLTVPAPAPVAAPAPAP